MENLETIRAREYFEPVYHETFEQLSRYVFFKSPGVADAEDVTATVYADYYRYVALPGKRPENPLSYLIRMAEHELSRLYGQRTLTLSFDDEELGLDETVADMSDTAGEVFEAFQSEELWAAVRRLSAVEQQILIARFRFDMTFPQIAAETGRRESTVKLAFYRSLKKLRKFLEPV